MADYNPISFKYLTGWGDVDLTPQIPVNASIEEIYKMLKKFPLKDRQYFKDQWRKAYGFYAKALLDDPDTETALNDDYLRKIARELG